MTAQDIDWSSDAARRLIGREKVRHDGAPAMPDPVDLDLAPPKPSGHAVELAASVVSSVERLLPLWREHGPAILGRVADWVKIERVPSSMRPETSGDDLGTAADHLSDDALFNLADDRRASAYYDEATAIANRLISDLTRLHTISTLARPPAPRRIEGRDMLAAQVIAAGLCVSCFRWDHTNKDREKDQAGVYFYAESCRRCGAFKAEHGIYPPLPLLEAWHSRGKNWTSTMVTEALAEASRPKAKAS